MNAQLPQSQKSESFALCAGKGNCLNEGVRRRGLIEIHFAIPFEAEDKLILKERGGLASESMCEYTPAIQRDSGRTAAWMLPRPWKPCLKATRKPLLISDLVGYRQRTSRRICQARPFPVNLGVREPGGPATYRRRSSLNKRIGDCALIESGCDPRLIRAIKPTADWRESASFPPGSATPGGLGAPYWFLCRMTL